MIRMQAYATFCLLFILVLSNEEIKQPCKENTTPIIKTTTGAVKGKMITVCNQDVLTFFGIPYAEPPIKNNRFKKPVPIKAWQGTLDATKKPTPCIQTKISGNYSWIDYSEPSENCLFLNIWVPKTFCNSQSSEKYPSPTFPIMVWIHGGGFFAGSSSLDLYDGSILAARGNVIVASMNYRLGAFGFFYSGTPDAPGNMGLLDQNLAIMWIKNNAKSFCGDPDKITLFGESAGSVSVGFHMVSPLSRNLFKRAIMESGSPFHPAMALDPELTKVNENKFATVLGCATEKENLINAPETVMKCLRNLDAKSIVQAENVILERTPFSFLPTYGDDFLPRSVQQAMSVGDFKEMEVLIGNNEDEGSIFLAYSAPEIFNVNEYPSLNLATAKAVIEAIFQQSVTPTAAQVADFYLSNVTDGNSEALLKTVKYAYGDFLFYCSSLFFAEKAAEKNDIYYYYFTHRPSHHTGHQWIGVAHGDEIPFVFGIPINVTTPYTAEERKFSFNIIEKWASFARNGKPETTAGVKWPKYTTTTHEYLELNPKSHDTGSDPHIETCAFWRKYFVDLTQT